MNPQFFFLLGMNDNEIIQISVLLFKMKSVLVSQMEQSCKSQGYTQVVGHFLWQ